jgi:hypothetical protein
MFSCERHGGDWPFLSKNKKEHDTFAITFFWTALQIGAEYTCQAEGGSSGWPKH